MIFNNSLNFINNSFIFLKNKIHSLYLNSNIYDKKITQFRLDTILILFYFRQFKTLSIKYMCDMVEFIHFM